MSWRLGTKTEVDILSLRCQAATVIEETQPVAHTPAVPDFSVDTVIMLADLNTCLLTPAGRLAITTTLITLITLLLHTPPLTGAIQWESRALTSPIFHQSTLVR